MVEPMSDVHPAQTQQRETVVDPPLIPKHLDIVVVWEGRRILEERPVSRSATFVFMIDDRFFGVVTAVVTGPEAGRYHFTSSLPVQILKVMAPQLTPYLRPGSEVRCAKH